MDQVLRIRPRQPGRYGAIFATVRGIASNAAVLKHLARQCEALTDYRGTLLAPAALRAVNSAHARSPNGLRTGE
jgi:hypothetical protein